MVDIIGSMNIKEAVLFCIFVMVFLNAVFVTGMVGIFMLFQGYAREKMSSEFRERLDRLEKAIADITIH